MEKLKTSLEPGDIVRVKRSKKDGRLIAYTVLGKIVLFKNWSDLHCGFARIDRVLCEKKNFVLVVAQSVPYDFYSDVDGVIPYAELGEVFANLGFVREYSLPIDKKNVFEVWANLHTGDLITVETWNHGADESYNSIKVFVPTGNNTAFYARGWTGFSHGDYYVCCFSVLSCKDEEPLHYILRISSESRNWYGETPSLWHYGDGFDFDHVEVLKRVYDFKDNIDQLFNMRTAEAIKRFHEFGVKRGTIKDSD